MSLGSLPTLVIVPPLNMLVLAVAGALLGRRRGGRTLLAVGLGGLVLFSLPVVPNLLIAVLESGLDRPLPPGPAPGAVVILSGDAAETVGVGGVPTFVIGSLTLEREQAGAAVARRFGLPVLVSGGVVRPGAPPIADLMATSMHDDFGVAVRWREERSSDTWENATETAAILRPAGITRVWLVTHAWHMKRALIAFRHAGLVALPAPVQIDARPDLLDYGMFVPSARAWLGSYYSMHELIGWAWYAFKAG